VASREPQREEIRSFYLLFSREGLRLTIVSANKKKKGGKDKSLFGGHQRAWEKGSFHSRRVKRRKKSTSGDPLEINGKQPELIRITRRFTVKNGRFEEGKD